MRWYPGQATPEITERERKMRAVARKAAAEGMVLLENNGVLPLKAGMKIALYGQGARHTIKGGTGSDQLVRIGVVKKSFHNKRYPAESQHPDEDCQKAQQRTAFTWYITK